MLRVVAALPLRAFHATGWVLGWLVWVLSPRFRRLTRENLAAAGLQDPQVLRQSVGEAGKGALEILPLWFRPQADVAALLQVGDDIIALIEDARAAGRGIIFITPHLGCFEITAQWYAHRTGPMTALFSPPTKGVMDYLIMSGREKPDLRLAAPGMRGMRALIRALKAGEAVGILPDQVPNAGEGEWSPFFGRPAYTMTLVQRLAESTGARIVVAFAERLPAGSGYRAYAQTMPKALAGESPARHLNRVLEDLIRRCPAQYLWSYNRYKVPAGVAPPQAGGA
ncbi:MAG: lysophospholipid acyltransferase family protein [Betaproteobacteria bacterium]|nr:lysophospholipid acyltransferase family protein [Betaproteobacteria bacterium]